MAQQFTNQAQLSFQNTLIASNTVVGEITDTLSATKTALQDSYTVGGRLTYAVSLTNAGSSALTDLTLTDDLGAAGGTNAPLTYVDGSILYFVNGVPQPDPTVTVTGGVLTVTGITVPAGGDTILLYETEVNAYASPEVGASVTNTVTVTGSLSPVTATSTVAVANGPILSVVKSIQPVPVTENGTVTYTFAIRNDGNGATVEGDNVALSDTFAPVLSDITVTYDGAIMPSTDFTYDPGTGLFQTLPGVISVPAATYTQTEEGLWVTTPGTVTLTVSGTI